MKMTMVLVSVLVFVLGGVAFSPAAPLAWTQIPEVAAAVTPWTQIPGATPDSPTAVFATFYAMPAIVTLVIGGDGSPYISAYAPSLDGYFIWTAIGCNSANVFDPWLRLSGWLGHHPSLVYSGGDVRIGGTGNIFILLQGGGNTIWRGSLVGLLSEICTGP
jgi:hypothetical protein